MATVVATNLILCLMKLCRLCGNYICHDPVNTENIKIRVDQAFFTELEEDRLDTHPPKICMKCYTNLRNIEKRGTTSNFRLSQWPLTCFIERCICFWKNPSRKKKKQCGRPSINDKVIWTRESISKIKKSFSGLPRLCHDSIDVADNPHKDLCVCKNCMRLLHKPVLLNNYQHLFCATCIFPYIIGKLETETKCTICFSNITLGSILKATSMQNILDSLFIECCKNTCKEKFTVKNISYKEEHEKTCKVRNK
nr:V(D)J recombination-activating protein 1-like [Hydra vulgaris]